LREEMMTPEIKSAIESYFDKCKKLVESHYNVPENCSANHRSLTLSFGKRYARLDRVRLSDNRPESVYAFVDTTNGDVLKPASYKAPAKHARGNVLDEAGGMKYVGAYGPAYLK